MPCDADRRAAACTSRATAYNAIAEALLPPHGPIAADPGELAAAAAELGLDGAGLARELEGAARLREAARAELYVRTFGPTAGGDHPPYSTEYDRAGAFRKEHELADIAGAYAAWGVRVAAHLAERADHFGVEADYLGFLALKEGYAVLSHSAARADEVRAWADRFAARYVAPAAGELLDRLARGGAPALFSEAAETLVALLELQGVPAGGRPRIVALPVVNAR